MVKKYFAKLLLYLFSDTVKTEIEVPDLKLRFVCKSCLADFDSLDKLKDHEKICIKGEYMYIFCIF